MNNRPNQYHAAKKLAEDRFRELAATTTMEAVLPPELRRFAPLILEIKAEEDADRFEIWLDDQANRRRLAAPGMIIARCNLGNCLGFDLRPIVSNRHQVNDERWNAIVTFCQALDEADINFSPARSIRWSAAATKLFGSEMIEAFDRCKHYDNDGWLVRVMNLGDKLLDHKYLLRIRKAMKDDDFAKTVTDWYHQDPTTPAAEAVYWSLRQLEFACGSGLISGQFLSPLDP